MVQAAENYFADW